VSPASTRLLSALLGLSACWLAWAGESEYRIEVIAGGLDHPWSLAFLPDGGFLLTERAGHLRIGSPNGRLSEPIADLPPAFVRSQGGLMDVAIHPDYADQGWVYLTLAHGNREANATRLIRGRIANRRWIDNQVLFTAQPTRSTPVHYGGRITFLPDRSLLLSIGDGFDWREDAQRLDSHTGSIVRLHDDGRIPTDNPFTGQADARAEIFSYGHRNPQGLVYDAERQLIWAHEHGPRGGDELNLLRPGGNYGWPIVTGGIDYSGARVTPFTTRPGLIDPVVDWTPSIAPAGLAVVRGAEFSHWRGDLLVASLAERSLRRLRFDQGQLIEQEIIDLDLDQRLRDVRIAPDGSIYLLTDRADGQILRVTRRLP